METTPAPVHIDADDVQNIAVLHAGTDAPLLNLHITANNATGKRQNGPCGPF